MDTQTQIDRLIELAIIQRTELKQLVEQLPQLREHLNAEVEKVFEETEPQLRAELEEWTTKQTADKTAALGVALEAKIANLAKNLEISTQARYSAIIAEREENARLAAQAEAKIAEHAASLPSAVKEIVSAELARFPRAGEIDQLRKEFAEPRGLNPRGKWQAGETYNRLDLVTYNGDSFVSNIDGNTEKPSRNAANWTLNAARGAYGGGGGITSLNDVLNAPTSGQIIGSQNGQYVPKTLVAGANITINETASSITIIGDEGQISLNDGTAALPALFFTNDTDTGIYRPAANTLGISVSGTQVAYFDANGITTVGAGATFDGSVHAANGNANNPSLSFTSDQDTGFFRHQPNELGIALGGTQYATLTSTTFSITPNVSTSGNLTVGGTGTSSVAGRLDVTKSLNLGGAAESVNFLGLNRNVLGVIANSAIRAYNLYNDGTNLNIESYSGAGVMAGAASLSATQFRVNDSAGGSRFAVTYSSGDTTIGGNLTTGSNSTISASSGYLLIQPTTTLYLRATSGSVAIGDAGSGAVSLGQPASTTTVQGNLTVSGTGTSSFAGTLLQRSSTGVGAIASIGTDTGSYSVLRVQNTAASGRSFDIGTAGSGDATLGSKLYIYDSTAGATRWTMDSSGNIAQTGNLLIGTTTDGGNGKLQLATHTTSAGGIGFGTADSFYTAGVGDFRLKTTSAEAAITLLSGGAYIGSVTAGKSTFIVSGSGTTALTLDTSQNATFAKTVTASSTGSAAAKMGTGFAGFAEFSNATGFGAAGTYALIQDNTGETYLNTASGKSLFLRVANANALTITSTTATFAGSIAINNTVQTAASVASTHKVTISIGGSTYYLLATNV